MTKAYVDLEVSLTPAACEMLSALLFERTTQGLDGSPNSELRTLAAELGARARNVQHYRVEQQQPAEDWLA